MKLHHAPTKNVADLLKVYWTWFWHLLGWTWAQTLVWYCSMTQVSDQWWALLVAWQWLTFEYRPRCHVQTGFRTRANLDLTKQDAVRKCAEIERFYCRSGSIQKKRNWWLMKIIDCHFREYTAQGFLRRFRQETWSAMAPCRGCKRRCKMSEYPANSAGDFFRLLPFEGYLGVLSFLPVTCLAFLWHL